MSIRVNDTAPDFIAKTSQAQVNFHEWIGDGWAILFSHPEDFTPVCATELGYVAKLSGEFAKRGCRVIGLSVDKVEDHLRWVADIEDLAGTKLDYPLIADEDLSIAKRYDMLPATVGDSSEGRTAADNMTVRPVFLVGPDKKVKMSLTYPMSTGRNFDALLRVIDSCQLTANHKVATPAKASAWGYPVSGLRTTSWCLRLRARCIPRPAQNRNPPNPKERWSPQRDSRRYRAPAGRRPDGG